MLLILSPWSNWFSPRALPGSSSVAGIESITLFMFWIRFRIVASWSSSGGLSWPERAVGISSSEVAPRFLTEFYSRNLSCCRVMKSVDVSDTLFLECSSFSNFSRFNFACKLDGGLGDFLEGGILYLSMSFLLRSMIYSILLILPLTDSFIPSLAERMPRLIGD